MGLAVKLRTHRAMSRTSAIGAWNFQHLLSQHKVGGVLVQESLNKHEMFGQRTAQHFATAQRDLAQDVAYAI